MHSFFETLLRRRKTRESGEKYADDAPPEIATAVDQVPASLEEVLFLMEDYVLKVPRDGISPDCLMDAGGR